MYLIIWLAPMLPIFWYLSRKIMWDQARKFGQTKPDGDDIVAACIIAMFVTVGWPVLIPLRALFNLVGGGKGIKGGFWRLYSKPKTREEKKAIKANSRQANIDAANEAKQEEISIFRSHVNDRERELELPLTVWSE